MHAKSELFTHLHKEKTTQTKLLCGLCLTCNVRSEAVCLTLSLVIAYLLYVSMVDTESRSDNCGLS